jgi:UDP-N-acetylglucosamine--N-acetylmuramyl-(pentapeptide) pyrophosphoryl-undecaprenol N-acetylglucosamine transferase
MAGCVLIAGGGTGGHLFPGVAVAGELKASRPGLKVVFVSAGRALESRILRRAGLPLEAVPVRPLRGRSWSAWLAAVFTLPRALIAAWGLLRRHRPGLVLAVGGYAAFPLGVAAWLAGVPLAVQEQNAVPGLTNRVLARLARVVFIAFAAAQEHLPAGKAVLTGNPVRPELVAAAQRAAQERPPAEQEFHLLVLGGSQGARSLNRAVCQALPRLAARRERLRFTHQTGEADREEVRAAYRRHRMAAEVEAFFEDMGTLYGRAHLVLCRAGASTLSELTACGRAAVCVPYPHAAGDHQTLNARALVEAGAARLVPDAELDGDGVAALVCELMDAPERLAEMEARARDLARPQAAREIATHCLALMQEAA